MWNDLQTDKEEGQEEELHVTDNKDRQKQAAPPFLRPFFSA